MGYIIGSFNLRNLGEGSAFDRTKNRNLKKYAEIIRREGFDIVAFQEVNSEGKAFWLNTGFKKSILMELGPMWDFWPGENASMRNVQYNSDYGFAWRKDRLEFPKNRYGQVIEPEIFEYQKNCRFLRRPPLVARFIPKVNPRMEIRLINVHLMSSKKIDMPGNEEEQRNEEFRHIAKEIFDRVEDKRYGDFRDAYTFILGDYNLNLKRWFNVGPFMDDEMELGKKTLITVQDKKTSLKKPREKTTYKDALLQSNELRVANEVIEVVREEIPDYYANNFDHFSYNKELLEKARIKDKRVDAVNKYYNKDSEKYQEELSDHVPIKLSFEANTRLDDWED